MPRTSRSRSVSTIVLTAGLLALTACTGPEPAPPPKSSPPVFENEEQALAAGAEAYESYLGVWNQVVADGGADPARIDEVTTGELRTFENESLSKLQQLGWTFSGAASLEVFTISDWYSKPDAAGVLIVGSACVDMTGLQAMDGAGESVIKPERPAKRTWSVHIAPGAADQRPYVLAKHEVIKEGSSCEE
ncbi:hypothetical protein ITJ66_04705 [Plantibacter sp. VKM Ac-2885]|uniref:hypothetical protein n=1 Tax=Plantibacter TaxID=190323 RepID=UPI0010C20DEF|nr:MULTISPECIES: hypothetical protein [Plantibacter]MBD8518042.1 hypothetical protein [Plantibacter sp. CFBP 8804]MBF4511780.1 hypothetical protein [Plantibacter sp. VKM Ac-2885]TKJ99246.1 hypothetical protein PlfCFBP13513_07595 [Plantibacter flavus]CAH0272909.1 hypothetical protein SRABI02_03728 [Plantibacter cousiniae]